MGRSLEVDEVIHDLVDVRSRTVRVAERRMGRRSGHSGPRVEARAGGIIGAGNPWSTTARRRVYRRADRAIPSAPASAARASASRGTSSGSGRVNVPERISQWRLASSTRPMRA